MIVSGIPSRVNIDLQILIALAEVVVGRWAISILQEK